MPAASVSWPSAALADGQRSKQVDTPGKKLLVGVAVTYLALVLLVPTLNVFVQAFAKGPGPFFGHLTDPDFLHAVRAQMLFEQERSPTAIDAVCCAERATDASATRNARVLGNAGLADTRSQAQNMLTPCSKVDVYASCMLTITSAILGCNAFDTALSCEHSILSSVLSCLQLSLTFSLALVAVPINTIFGISVALLIARNEFPGKARARRLLCVHDLTIDGD